MEEGSSNRDCISQLPDAVLHSILSLLTPRMAASTSVLSKRWRYVFHSLPSLDLGPTSFTSQTNSHEELDFRDPYEPFDDIQWLRTFNALLVRRRAAVQSISIALDVLYRHEEPFFHFTRQLCKKGVEDLRLRSWKSYYTIPAHFFSCTTLITLDLAQCWLSVPPAFAGLQRLRSLSLERVTVTDYDIRHMVSRCGALEELSMWCCFRVNNLVINSPCLCKLKVVTHRPLWISVERAPRLASVSVKFHYDMKGFYTLEDASSDSDCFDAYKRSDNSNSGDEEEASQVNRIVRLLKGLGQRIERLELGFPEDCLKKMCKEGVPFPKSMPVGFELLGLKRLCLYMNPTHENSSAILSCLLNTSPNLQLLVIKEEWGAGYGEPASDFWAGPQAASCCMLNHLSAIFICIRKGSFKKFVPLTGFLLKTASALEKLHIYYEQEPKEQSSLVDFQHELLQMPRGSLNAVVNVKPVRRFGDLKLF